MNTFRQAAVAVGIVGILGATAAGVAFAGNSDRHDHPSVAELDQPPRLDGRERAHLRNHTRHLRDVQAAIDAGYIPTDVCVADPALGGMGYHYVHPGYIADDIIDTTKPEVLVYHDGPNGELRLGAVEWLRFDADQDLATTDDRPFLFERYPFDGPMEGHEPGMPRHYDLHVWLYHHNPAGELTGFNPRVTCPD